MNETKLPPGPWRAKDATRRNDGSIDSRTIEDATGKWVLVATDWGEIAARSPEVLHAVLALPLLVEAARGVMELHDRDELAIKRDGWYEVPRRFITLREALAAIDGEKETAPP